MGLDAFKTIDVIEVGGNRNNKNAEIVCGKILNKWRALGLPVFHIRHNSANLKSKLHNSNEGFEFNETVWNSETIE